MRYNSPPSRERACPFLQIVEKASQSSPPQRRIEFESFSARACTWQKIPYAPLFVRVVRHWRPWGPRKAKALWGEEEPRHRRNFPLAGNGALWLVLRRSARGGVQPLVEKPRRGFSTVKLVPGSLPGSGRRCGHSPGSGSRCTDPGRRFSR